MKGHWLWALPKSDHFCHSAACGPFRHYGRSHFGIGRAIGETMAVIMVVGNQARIPDSILDGVRTLTANIVLEMGYAADLHREALIATGVVLFAFILLINFVFQIFKRKEERE